MVSRARCEDDSGKGTEAVKTTGDATGEPKQVYIESKINDRGYTKRSELWKVSNLYLLTMIQ
jgi:hypothetical protein